MEHDVDGQFLAGKRLAKLFEQRGEDDNVPGRANREELADSLDDRKQNDLEEKHALVLGGQKVHLRGQDVQQGQKAPPIP